MKQPTPCPYCGTTMVSTTKRRTRHCGATECKRLYNNARNLAYAKKRAKEGRPLRRTTYTVTCEQCGSAATVTTKSARFCSARCGVQWASMDEASITRTATALRTAMQRPVKFTCETCGQESTGTNRQRFCSNGICKWLSSNPTTCPVYYHECRTCHKAFAWYNIARTHCSEKCKGSDSRLHRKHAALIHKRDNYTCHICGLPTLRQWDENNRWESPSLDHIIPRAHGGTDEPDNLATAHFICNARRGTRPVEPISLAA